MQYVYGKSHCDTYKGYNLTQLLQTAIKEWGCCVPWYVMKKGATVKDKLFQNKDYAVVRAIEVDFDIDTWIVQVYNIYRKSHKFLEKQGYINPIID